MKVKFLKEHPDAKLPTKGSKEAACYDLYAVSIEKIQNTVIVNYGFSTEIPVGYKAIIVPRSNITKHSWVIPNSPCQIDSDYRGVWMTAFHQLSIYNNDGTTYVKDFPYKVGERVAQMYFEKEEVAELEWSNELKTSERGSGGFGSTGLK